MIDHEQRRQDSEAAIERLRLERQEIEVQLLALAKPLALAVERDASTAADAERVGADLHRAMEAGNPAGELRERWADARAAQVEARSEVDRLSLAGRQLGKRLEAIALETESWAARRDAAAQHCA